MKSGIRTPSTFQEFSAEPITIGCEDLSIPEIEGAIKHNALFATYSEWNFDGKIWWDNKTSSWCGEVWEFDEYITSYTAKTLKALADEIYSDYGEAEVAVSPLIVRRKKYFLELLQRFFH